MIADLIFCRNAHYPPHSHGTLTTHLVLRGELVISYPKDEEGPHPNDIGAVAIHEGDGEGTKWKYGVGGRIDVDEEREHEVWLGPEGCTYVIGEK